MPHRTSDRKILLTVAITALAPLLTAGAHCNESCPSGLAPVKTRTLALTLDGAAALVAWVPSSSPAPPLSIVSHLEQFPERALRVDASRPVVVSLEKSPM